MIIKLDTVNSVSGFIADSSIAKKACVQDVECGLMVAIRIEAMRLMAEVMETRRRTCTLETRIPVMMSVTAATTTMGRKRREVWRVLSDWTRWKLWEVGSAVLDWEEVREEKGLTIRLRSTGMR